MNKNKSECLVSGQSHNENSSKYECLDSGHSNNENRRIFREPLSSYNVTSVSNDILDFNFLNNDTAKILLLRVLREPNDFRFTVLWAEVKLGHSHQAIYNALEILERFGYLKRIPVSIREVYYYFYESPALNPDFISPTKPKKRNKIRSKKGTSIVNQVKQAIRKIEQAQAVLINLTNDLDLRMMIDSLQRQRKELMNQIDMNDPDDLYDYDDI